MDTYVTRQPLEYLMYKQIMSTEEIKLLKSVQTSARLEFIQRWVHCQCLLNLRKKYCLQ